MAQLTNRSFSMAVRSQSKTATARRRLSIPSRPRRRAHLPAVGLCLAFSAGLLWASEGTAHDSANTESTPPTAAELVMLRDALEPLNFDQPGPHSEPMTAHLGFYGLLTTQHKHLFGTFRSGPHVLAAPMCRLASPRGTRELTAPQPPTRLNLGEDPLDSGVRTLDAIFHEVDGRFHGLGIGTWRKPNADVH